jgi:hypothetical protein
VFDDQEFHRIDDRPQNVGFIGRLTWRGVGRILKRLGRQLIAGEKNRDGKREKYSGHVAFIAPDILLVPRTEKRPGVAGPFFPIFERNRARRRS